MSTYREFQNLLTWFTKTSLANLIIAFMMLAWVRSKNEDNFLFKTVFFACPSAVNSLDTAMGLSVYSTYSLEDVARESPNTIKFMQMQFYTDRELMVDLLKQAEKAGYKAVLLTVDIPVYGRHKKRASFFLPDHLKFANFVSLKKKKGLRNNEELNAYIGAACDSSVDWQTFDWLRSTTSLPFVVKGILTAEDARLAVQHGAQGIMVSNHGARQLDGVPATVCVINVKLFLIFLLLR